MGSEGPLAPAVAVTVHVTGFKKFHGVSENPTETIVSNLKEYVKKKGLPKGLTLGSCSILETAGQGALASLYQTLQSAIGGKDSESSTSGKIIWVSCPHFWSPLQLCSNYVMPNYSFSKLSILFFLFPILSIEIIGWFGGLLESVSVIRNHNGYLAEHNQQLYSSMM